MDQLDSSEATVKASTIAHVLPPEHQEQTFDPNEKQASFLPYNDVKGSSSACGLISAKLRETCTRSVVGSRHFPKKVASSSFVPRGKTSAAPSKLKIGGSAVVAPKQRRDGELKGFEEV